MKNYYRGVVCRLRLLCVSWSFTFLSTGIAFVYANLYECINTEFDMGLKTFSVGLGIGGFVFSLGLSLNSYLYRKRYERTIL